MSAQNSQPQVIQLDEGWKKVIDMISVRLDEVNSNLTSITTKVEGLRIEVGKLKVKAGYWGATAGLTSSVGILILAHLKNLF